MKQINLFSKEDRDAIRKDPKFMLKAMSNEADIVVRENNKDTYYFVIPYLDGANENILDNINVAKVEASSAGSVSSASSVATLSSLLGTLGSASSAGTITSASSVQ